MKTDADLQRDVVSELAWEPSVHAARIGVEVNSGVVTLAGQVDSFWEKWHAESAARRVYGVQAVTTTLSVHLSDLGTRTDGDIAASVKNVIEWTSPLPAGTIKLMVEAGWVTLSGQVDWQFQRAAVLESVRYLMGVTGVSNQITIKPAFSAEAIKSDIEAALARVSPNHERHVSVEVLGGDITLSGTVDTWSERDTAVNSAWGAPGVRNVTDMLRLNH